MIAAFTKSKKGPVHKFRNITFFAYAGVIAFFDDRDESYRTILADDFEERARFLTETSKKNKSDLKLWQRQERDDLLRFAQSMLDAVKEAKEMGDPNEPAVQAYLARHHRRSTTGFTPAKPSKPLEYPELRPLDMGRFTGRTCRSDSQIVAAEHVPRVHCAPTRKQRPGVIFNPQVL